MGPPPLSVLEIGCGNGGSAVAMARAGYDVLGIDVSSVRIAQAVGLDRVVPMGGPHAGRPELRCADMYSVELDRTFEAVVYWNGFGVGTDLHQRTLLGRIEGEWLHRNGLLLMDVYSPWRWSAEHGRRSREFDLVRQVLFDPVEVRFEESWWKYAEPHRVLTQSGRCYAVPDLIQLLSKTGLDLVNVAISPDEGEMESATIGDEQWFQAWSWLAVIHHEQAAQGSQDEFLAPGRLRDPGAEEGETSS